MQIRTLPVSAIVAAALLASCASSTTSEEGTTGSLALTLELANGATIDQVEWVITRPGMDPMSGLIDTSAPSATASIEVFGLEPGDNYKIEMTARSSDEGTECRGFTEFSVTANEAEEIMVVLNCDPPARFGSVRVDGKFNICAELAKVIVSPLQTSVDNEISLSAVGIDSDGPNEGIEYLWTATDGDIAEPTAQDTTFTCTSVSDPVITITVSDDGLDFCEAEWPITVKCVDGGGTDVDEVVFFGDSLSDTGNVWYATQGLPPPPYFQGTSGEQPDFTGGQWSSPEGPSWPTPFASTFGLTATPSAVGGNNYAWGGARTGMNTDPAGVPWLEQQVALYASSGSSPGPGTLVSIMIGGNDVANNLENPDALQVGVTSITTQITNLHNLGVDQFVVANVPDVGATPRFQDIDAQVPGTAQLATLRTTQWNALLATALDELSASLPEAEIGFLDLFAIGQDPELLALFENTTDACLVAEPPSLCDDPASYFYWDSFHPSSTAHAIIAEAANQATAGALLQVLLP